MEKSIIEKKILVVDDEPQIIKKLSAHLRENGYSVAVAYDGEQGLAMVREEKPDLIISDIMMPNMNGPTMVEILKNEPSTSGIPVIFLTALIKKKEEKDQPLLFRGNYVMAKPFNPAELLMMINKVLNENR